MAFRKRNQALGSAARVVAPADLPSKEEIAGIRPSSLTSHPVTSTGTPSLDSLLGGHGGLALGSGLLTEESGTTDFAGALLRFYAAEGVCQGHVIHLVGVGESWTRELPGVAEERPSARKEKAAVDDEKMKIAWRYESLGQTGERAVPGHSTPLQASSTPPEKPFCHTFDLTKRLAVPQDARIEYLQVSTRATSLPTIIQSLRRSLESSSTTSIHRLVIPTVLSPAIYPPSASRPDNFLRFMHSLRALLRRYHSKLTVMMTLPLELFPRKSGLIRWAEILSDGVLELTPFPRLMDASNSLAENGGSKSNEEQPQGMLKVHKLPINSERGEGGAGAESSIGQDLSFTVSRRKFIIKPFSLPPLEGDQDAQKDAGKLTGKDVEF